MFMWFLQFTEKSSYVIIAHNITFCHHLLLSAMFSAALIPNILIALIKCNVRRKVTYNWSNAKILVLLPSISAVYDNKLMFVSSPSCCSNVNSFSFLWNIAVVCLPVEVNHCNSKINFLNFSCHHMFPAKLVYISWYFFNLISSFLHFSMSFFLSLLWWWGRLCC